MRPYRTLKMPTRLRIKQLADAGMSYPAICVALSVYEGVEGTTPGGVRNVARAMGVPPRKKRGRPVSGKDSVRAN